MELDDIDRLILELLRADGRRTVRDIAARVNLSPAPVQRRIQRLERDGVITGYTVTVDHRKVGRALEAFTEVRYGSDVSIDEIFGSLTSLAEVVAAYTTAGDSDALVHLRVKDVAHLQEVIGRLRESGNVGMKTRVVLERRLPAPRRDGVS